MVCCADSCRCSAEINVFHGNLAINQSDQSLAAYINYNIMESITMKRIIF
ncbi:hypothetical protein B7P43_G01477 [Cryptotermes secundus]|uniref:Uncharacterized protein n=1 Tax=Cryptotermes secundus TaxID=105785 RepID=A0A2J7RK55_9NEOP|nr:hypothetical protein B7P43_G01477 [Cryptotermes secundus]